MTAMIDRTMASAAAMMPATTVNGKDMRADMAQFMRTEVAKIVPQSVAASERVYAESFTEAQLQRHPEPSTSRPRAAPSPPSCRTSPPRRWC